VPRARIRRRVAHRAGTVPLDIFAGGASSILILIALWLDVFDATSIQNVCLLSNPWVVLVQPHLTPAERREPPSAEPPTADRRAPSRESPNRRPPNRRTAERPMPRCRGRWTSDRRRNVDSSSNQERAPRLAPARRHCGARERRAHARVPRRHAVADTPQPTASRAPQVRRASARRGASGVCRGVTTREARGERSLPRCHDARGAGRAKSAECHASARRGAKSAEVSRR